MKSTNLLQIAVSKPQYHRKGADVAIELPQGGHGLPQFIRTVHIVGLSNRIVLTPISLRDRLQFPRAPVGARGFWVLITRNIANLVWKINACAESIRLPVFLFAAVAFQLQIRF